MESKVKEAVQRKMCGYNCAQAVACTYCEQAGLDATMRKFHAKDQIIQDGIHSGRTDRHGGLHPAGFSSGTETGRGIQCDSNDRPEGGEES